MARVKDPVCDMEFDESEAVATVEHQGNIYFFCSEGCARKFERDPDKYVGTMTGGDNPADNDD
jgi:P-type Cu+ transporter